MTSITDVRHVPTLEPGVEFFGNRPFPMLRCSAFLAFTVLLTSAIQAALITTADIVELPKENDVSGSGNGTLDLRMFTFSGSEIDNDSSPCAFDSNCDFDNASNDLPQGGGADTNSFAESYVTTAGELQDFYALNFGATGTGQVELVLFLDLNETGGGAPNNEITLLDIISNPATIQGSPNPGDGGTGNLDVTSSAQDAINQVYTSDGGTIVLAELSPEPAANIAINSQGAGFADWAIFTGIDPFALSASDLILFNVSMGTLNSGAEEIFVSGDYLGSDITTALQNGVPEPSTYVLGAISLLALGFISWRRRQA